MAGRTDEDRIFAPDFKQTPYWWEAAAPPAPAAPPLPERVDVAVIGGGYCGLNAALELARRGTRVAVDWTSPADLSRRECKLAFQCILCLETALGQGGRIAVDRGESRWTLTGSAPRLRIDPELWEALSNPAAAPEIGPGQVQFLLVPEEVARQHRRLTVEMSGQEIRLTF